MTEKDISKNTGVSKDELRGIRNKKIPNSDWENKKGVGVVYKDSGVYILSKILGIPRDRLTNKNPQSWAKVVKLPKNPLLVMVESINEGEKEPKQLRMKVKDNAKFVLGMVVPIRSINGDVCYLDRRQPRVKGIW